MQVSPLINSLAALLPQIRRSKRNAFITILLLVSEEPELIRECLQSIRDGQAKIDEELILTMYTAGDRATQLALARSAPVSRMSPSAFRKIFDEVYARSDLTGLERRDLVWSLDSFLLLNPRQRFIYEGTILDLLKSPHRELRLRALSMVGRLDHLTPATLNVLARNLKSRDSGLRLNALDGFHALFERFGRLDPHVRDFIASDSFRSQVARMRREDPDSHVRHNANSVLLIRSRACGPERRLALRIRATSPSK